MPRKKKTRKTKQKSEEISLPNEGNGVNLTISETIKPGIIFCGAKVLRGNEMWKWDSLEDIQFK